MMILLMNPALMLAAGGGGDSNDLWKIINFVVFVLIFIYLLRNKIGIGKVFDARAAAIVKDLEQARRDKQEAEQKLAEVQARLNRLDEEVAEIRLETERERQREAERIAASTAADIEKIKQTAQREMDGALKAARTELRAFVAEHAVQLAEATIKRELKPEDEKKMMAKYVDGLSEVKR